MKIIFLDFDGVLNSGEWLSRHDRKTPWVEKDWFDPSAVGHLNSITNLTGAKIVISSSWRVGRTTESLEKLLRSVGVSGEVVGKTESFFERASAGWVARGLEIQAWLDCMSDVESFVILDDNNDMEHLLPFLVHTDSMTGLRSEHVEKAVRVLNRGPVFP